MPGHPGACFFVASACTARSRERSGLRHLWYVRVRSFSDLTASVLLCLPEPGGYCWRIRRRAAPHPKPATMPCALRRQRSATCHFPGGCFPIRLAMPGGAEILRPRDDRDDYLCQRHGSDRGGQQQPRALVSRDPDVGRLAFTMRGGLSRRHLEIPVGRLRGSRRNQTIDVAKKNRKDR